VAPAFLAIDDVVTSIQSDQMEGSLTLASIHSLSYFFLGPLFRDFSRDYPSVKVCLLTRSSVETVELLETKRADAGLVYDTAVVSPALRSTPLFQSEMALIARCDSDLPSEVNLRELELTLVVFPQNHALRRMLTSSKVSFKIAAEADTYDAMLDMTSFGVGNCILPNRIPDGYLTSRGLRKVKIAEPPLSRQVAFVVHAESSKAPMLNRLETAVLREARSLLTATAPS
jgi:DNA-binding transcriptional LysR family regulator